jgi:hypothetical protein
MKCLSWNSPGSASWLPFQQHYNANCTAASFLLSFKLLRNYIESHLLDRYWMYYTAYSGLYDISKWRDHYFVSSERQHEVLTCRPLRISLWHHHHGNYK